MTNLVKYIVFACIMFVMVDQGYAQETYVQNNYAYVSAPAVPQPVPYLQVMVYQAPYYTVTVPVVVNPLVAETRVVWGYPYVPVTVPVQQYRYWGYDRRCWPLNRY
jgi:hypothetical protein